NHEASVLCGRIVQQKTDRQNIVIRVRIKGGVLMPLDRRSDPAALQVQLAVMELNVRAEQFGDDVGNWRVESDPPIYRMVVSGICDATNDGSVRRVQRIEVEDAVAFANSPRTIDELFGRRAQLIDR